MEGHRGIEDGESAGRVKEVHERCMRHHNRWRMEANEHGRQRLSTEDWEKAAHVGVCRKIGTKFEQGRLNGFFDGIKMRAGCQK
jgi:hypothetical protein